MKKWILGIFLLFSLVGQAKVFKNAYIAFEMQDTWNCILEQTEWVCRSSNEKESKEAIIILTAKEVGPTDTFDAYMSHLSTIQPRPGMAGAEAKVVYAPKRTKVNDQDWVDGLQLSSEIPNYYTRYLATIKDRIAVLVTFSAHKNHYTKYSQEFFKSIQSLRVIASKNLLSKPDAGVLRPGSETLGQGIQAAIPGDLTTLASPTKAQTQKNKFKFVFLGLGLVLLAIGLYLFAKKK